MVVDWRADVSTGRSTGPPGPSRWASSCAAGSASSTGAITAYEDEHLTDAGRGDRRTAAILEGEIERPRVGPMRDIVATIQPEQDVIVRADVGHDGLRAGRAGHRQDRGRPAPRGVPALRPPRPADPQGVLVVGPNARFLRYIGDVLPALGEIDATQPTTVERAASALRVTRGARRGDDAPRRDAQGRRAAGRGAAPGAVVARAATPTEALVVPRGCAAVAGRDVRGRGDRRRAARAAASGTAPRARCCRSGSRTRILVRDGGCRRLPRRPGAGRGRAQQAGQGRTPTRCGRRVDPARLVLRLLVGRRLPGRAPPTGCSTTDEQALLLWAQAARGPRPRPVVAGRRGAGRRGRRPGRAHAVASATSSLDEAQDLSPMMLRARRAAAARPGRPPCSATSPRPPRRGRPARGTRRWRHLGKPDAHVEELDRGFRVPAR